MFQYLKARDVYFPGMGYEATVVLSNVSLNSKLTELDHLISGMESSGRVHEIDAWYPYFKEYGNVHFGLGELS